MSEQSNLQLDGSQGEGGGQILRTALSLSLITGTPFELVNARAKRPNPGLRAQHVACLEAAAQMSGGSTEGAEIGSSHVLFRPGTVRPGEYSFEIGTAGAVTLLAQALAMPLALAAGPSVLRLRGGTHVPHAPSFHYLSLVWAPMVARLGFLFRTEMIGAGFHPEGGGEILVRVAPSASLSPVSITHRGTLLEAQVLCIVGGLSYGVAERLKARGVQRLRDAGILAEAEIAPLISTHSKGSVVMCMGQFENCRAATSALGEQGKPVEKPADEASRDFVEFMGRRGALDPHLADQLILPAALAAAGVRPRAGLATASPPPSRFTTSAVTRHLTTNAEVVTRFLDVAIDIKGNEGEEGEVLILPRPTASL